MSGVRTSVGLDEAPALAALDALLARAEDLTPALQDFGEHWLNTTRARFRTATAPDGTPWAPLSDVTKARKKKNVDKILVLDGLLSGLLRYQVENNELVLGSDRVYAAVHQFGAEKGAFGRTRRGAPIPWGDIPARPFLGFTDDDQAQLTEILNEFLLGR